MCIINYNVVKATAYQSRIIWVIKWEREHYRYVKLKINRTLSDKITVFKINLQWNDWMSEKYRLPRDWHLSAV